MNIGLDYDDTYTRDPELWDNYIIQAQRRGHKVYIVTWRFPDEWDQVKSTLGVKVDAVYTTCRQAKEKYMFNRGIFIHVWIDDNPWAVLNTMQGYES